MVCADCLLKKVGDGLEFCVFGVEITITDDRAELVFRDASGDLVVHAAVKRGPEFIFWERG